MDTSIFTLEFRGVLGEEWEGMPMLLAPRGADQYDFGGWCCVLRGGVPHVALELIRGSAGLPEFRGYAILGNVAFVGFGRRVFRVDLVRLVYESVVKCRLYLTTLCVPSQLGEKDDDCVLVADESSVIKLHLDGRWAWAAEGVGLDGVVLHRIEDGELLGSGEWDPPGGWSDFVIDMDTGEVIRGRVDHALGGRDDHED
jgi:hypothetical protein